MTAEQDILRALTRHKSQTVGSLAAYLTHHPNDIVDGLVALSERGDVTVHGVPSDRTAVVHLQQDDSPRYT